ncbi:MAG TPA: L-rhamnose mutarotase [Acidimicrobiales bacterium]|nr:L-rhamnose mutarotase [Acidimicrobiales bacterium]
MTAPITPVYGPSNPSPADAARAPVRQYASVVELKPAMEQEYRRLHGDVWPEVRAAIRKANIRNYNIYVAELGAKRYLFSFFEYTGRDPASDFAIIANDPTTRDRWWPITSACQARLPGTPEGEQWMPLERVMRLA